MSRSYRRPFATWVDRSNKEDKRYANRRFRKSNRDTLRHFTEEEIIKFLYKLREISNTYNFNTDGLAHYYKKRGEEDDFWDKIQRK